ncbi:MAG: class I SAM-dependent methyltransferase [Lysobacterales bacterium]
MPFARKKISAYEAMYEAQKIAYAPVIFQVVRSLRDLGILKLLEESGKAGMSAADIGEALELSQYGVETLLESGHSCNVVEYNNDVPAAYKDRVYFLSKIGYFLLNDPMTRINMDFNHHVCYHGLARLDEAISDGKPRGLASLDKQRNTFYEALPHLPDDARNSWYRFDHYYSDISYPFILPIVLRNQPETLVDIGTNTGKFAILMAQSHPDIKIYMIDLPDQLAVARENAGRAGVSDRINAIAMDLLKTDNKFPPGLDVYWMSQFLSCFGQGEIISILQRVCEAMHAESRLFIMETCWDRQKHEASAFSLVNTSPYFTCIANGNSKMYHSEELQYCVSCAGLELVHVTDGLGICHSLFECRKKPQ